jgi:two-component system invasion response regulator UvrY
MARKITVLLVDDHELVRSGLRNIIAGEPDILVVGEAPTGESALKAVRELKPDVVLMDIKMPGMGGLEATKRMIHAHVGVRVIVLTSFVEDPYPAQLLQNGAAGFLTKNSASSELIDAIRRVSRGQHYVSAAIAQELAIRSVLKAPYKSQAGDVSLLAGLSKREMQILIMVSHGMSVKEISQKLSVTPKTINSHRYQLYKKLKVQTDVALSHIAIRHGLLEISQIQSLTSSEDES